MVANGLDWPRYWVAFDNGVEMGSLGNDKLVRDKEWTSFLKERDAAGKRAAEAPDESTGASPAGAAGEGAAAGSGGATVNGVAVPQLLIDRTRSALTRLGVSR